MGKTTGEERPNTTSRKQNSKPVFELTTSRQFQDWISTHHVSLLFTTYQVGKVFMVGTNYDRTLHVTERTFSRCMGLGMPDDHAETFWMSSIFQLWRFDNSLQNGRYQEYDKVYLPQVAYTTGDIDIHDIVIDKDEKPVFVNTLFSCLATISERHSFEPVWQPPFISKLVPEDRCHMNGLAARDGHPAYVTMVSQSDASDGWREHREDGGVVMDVQTNEVVCEHLSMPHSPRWYNGQLYILEAGTGFFGKVNLEKGTFEPMAFCPGFLRGLDFVDNYAIIAMSGARKNKTFSGLALDKNLKKKNTEPRCGIQIINLDTGATEHWIRLEGLIEELYDVKALVDVKKPLLIGTRKNEIRTMLSVPTG